MAEEWFRSAEWTDEARSDFEQRLERARGYSRPQYLRIKGLALADAGEVEAARSLWRRVLDSTEDLAVLQKAGALEHLADSYVGQERDLAEHYLRRLLAEHPSLNGTSNTQHITLAELLLSRGTRADLEEATTLLTRWAEETHVPFPSVHFRRELALIRLGEATGDREAVRDAARRALQLAARGPRFSRHKTVGVVHTDKRTLKRLQWLAR